MFFETFLKSSRTDFFTIMKILLIFSLHRVFNENILESLRLISYQTLITYACE